MFGRVGPCAKTVAAAAAALTAAQTVVPMSPAAHGWVTVALAGLGAVAVYAVPNASSTGRHAARE